MNRAAPVEEINMLLILIKGNRIYRDPTLEQFHIPVVRTDDRLSLLKAVHSKKELIILK